MKPSTAQSALHPAPGSGAELLYDLGFVLYVGAAIIFTIVMTLAIYAVIAKGRPIDQRKWVVGGGVVFPTVTLTALLFYSIAIGNGLSAIGSANALQLFLECFGVETERSQVQADRVLTVEVIGKQWWWEVRYPQGASGDSVVLANEIRIPTNRPVELVLSTTDVIHSFWAPTLAGKVDMIPGRTTRLRVQSTVAGVYRAQCAEYCGGQHALMALFVIVQEPNEFNAWIERQRLPAQVPTNAFHKRGYDAFFRAECQSCHTIRGTPANGTEGPDLTHVGGRHSLGAGVLNNHIGTMAGWIAGSQEIKPGNKMPAEPWFTGEELRALADWLGSLE